MNTQQRVILVVLIAFAVVAYRAYTHRRQAHSSDSMPVDPNILMPEMADRAVQFTRDHGKTLDFSPESVKTVEALLGDLHELRTKGQLSDRELNLHALHFGAYVGEVLRRKYNGSWAIDHSVAGPKSFPIHWNGGESFPVGWCGKRILNGDEDNVWFKYQVVTADDFRKNITSDSSTSRPTTAE